jgi:ABC-type transport system involved in cytochrome c biogenesis permease subunit
MPNLEPVFFYITIFSYCLLTVVLIGKLFFKNQIKYIQFAQKLLLIFSFTAHTITIIVRWYYSEHIPVMGNYENILLGSWCIILFSLLISVKFNIIKNFFVIIYPVVILMLGFSLVESKEISPLTPPYQSPWLVVHIIFAWFAYASFTITFALSIPVIFKNKKNQFFHSGENNKILFNMVLFGFLNHSVMIIAGAIWANLLWGSYWNWDPVETWSLITWFLYGLYLHLMATYNWKGKKAAWLSFITYIILVISFWWTNLVGDSIHIFNLIR